MTNRARIKQLNQNLSYLLGEEKQTVRQALEKIVKFYREQREPLNSELKFLNSRGLDEEYSL